MRAKIRSLILWLMNMCLSKMTLSKVMNANDLLCGKYLLREYFNGYYNYVRSNKKEE